MASITNFKLTAALCDLVNSCRSTFGIATGSCSSRGQFSIRDGGESRLFKHARFHSAEEFVTFFKVSRHFVLPNPQASGHLSIKEDTGIRELAQSYFKALRASLSDFFKLHPSATQLRSLLETPLQFPVALEDDLGPKYQFHRGKYFSGGHDLFSILHATLKFGLSHAQTIHDWLQIATFNSPNSLPYQNLQRWAIDHYLHVAIRLGDPQLAWMDHLMSSRGNLFSDEDLAGRLSWTRELFELRNGVEPLVRSDLTLTNAAISRLIQGDARQRAQRVFFQPNESVHTHRELAGLLRNNREVAMGHLITSLELPWPATAKTTEHFEVGILTYLMARSEAGSELAVPFPELGKLIEIAAKNHMVVIVPSPVRFNEQPPLNSNSSIQFKLRFRSRLKRVRKLSAILQVR